jgi:hypothetical protein
MSRQLVTNPDLKNPIPLGGTSGQVLAKNSATDYDVAWVAQSGGGLTIPLGQNLTWAPDATYDIGASGANRPRDLFMSRNLVVGGTVTTGTVGPSASGTLNLRSSGSIRWQIDSSTGAFLSASDGTLDIGASAAGRPRNLFLTSYTQQNEIAKPANPAAGQVRIYPKSDHHVYSLDSTGLETDLTVGGMTQAQADARYLQLTGGTVSGGILAASTGLDLASAGTRWRNVFATTVDANLVGSSTGITVFQALGGNAWQIDSNTAFTPVFDTAFDVGSVTLRPRVVYAGNSVNTPRVTQAATGDLTLIAPGGNIFLLPQAASNPTVNLTADGLNKFYIDGAGNFRWSSGAQLVLQMGNQERWAFRTNGNMEALYDNTIDIGNSGGSRPRNIYAATLIVSPAFQAPGGSPSAGGYQFVDNNNGLFYNGTRMEQRFWTGQWDWVRRENSMTARLSVQGNNSFGIGTDANPPLIRTPASSTTGLSLEAPNGFVVIGGKGGSNMGGNAYHDGTNWMRYDVAQPAIVVNAGSNGLYIYAAPAGANPISYTTRIGVPITGPVTLPVGTAQSWLASIRGGNGFNTSSNGVWVKTSVEIANLVMTGATARIDWGLSFANTVAGAACYVGIGIDGAAPAAPDVGMTSPVASYGMAASGTLYWTPAAGTHSVALWIQTSAGTMSLNAGVYANLNVTEQRC